MITVKDIWKHIAKEEGGYCNDKYDPGGETKFGICKRSYPHINIRAITIDEAENLFVDDYFKKFNGQKMLDISGAAAFITSDFVFNSGVSRGSKTLQKAINKILETHEIDTELVVDGNIGQKTLDALTIIKDIDNAEEGLVKAFKAVRQSFYEGLSTFSVFGKGWTSRNTRTTEKALELLKGSGV